MHKCRSELRNKARARVKSLTKQALVKKSPNEKRYVCARIRTFLILYRKEPDGKVSPTRPMLQTLRPKFHRTVTFYMLSLQISARKLWKP